ncbi:Cyclin N-terminal domain-containing protein [Psidium guajava]|nr:Cyclin N-terminal domain-containing protein [Psidium guajava]
MVCPQSTDRLSKGARETELDLSSLHLLADTASLVSEGKLSLDSSTSDVDDAKKATGMTTTFGPFGVGWIVTKKRSPRARGLTIHSQKWSSGAVNAVGPKNRQVTRRGVAENCKKRTRAFDPTETLETGRVSKKTKKKGLAPLIGPSELPIQYMDKIREMRGRDVTLVVEKKLTTTDMSRCQSRLSIPRWQIRGETFLGEEEIRILNGKEGITVSLIEPCLEVSHGLQLKKWNYMSDNFSYVLKGRWNGVAHPYQRNELIKDVRIQLWSFRVHGNLHFCLTKVEEAPVSGI